MPDRRMLFVILWLTSSLELVASVCHGPIPTSGSLNVSAQPDVLFINFALPPSQPTTQIDAVTTTDAVPQVNAVPSDNEEEEDRAEALEQSRVSLLIPRSFRKVAEHQLIARRSTLSHYPLRC